MQSQNQTEQGFLGSINGLDGKPIYVDLRDGRGRRLIEAGGNFNPPTLAIWHRLLGEDDWTHVIDVGANYGEMLANGKLPKSARIMAVEPNTRVLPFLKKTLSGLDGVKLFEVALSDKEGHAKFLVNENWSGLSRIVPDGSETTMVPTTTLEKLLKMDGMPLNEMRVLVKIDVEGHEVNVLRGMIDALPFLQNFCALIEIAHMNEIHIKWIVLNFDVHGFNMQSQQFQKIESLYPKDMKASCFYDQDVVIRKRARRGQ
jgi:FkbM family methyltransferase